MPAPRHILLTLTLLTLPFGGCSRLQILNGLTSAGGYDRTSGIAYGSSPRQKLDIYTPHGGKAKGVVIFLYGGSWRNGERKDFKFAAQALTSRKYIAIVPDYRIYPDATFPAFVEDAAAVVHWAHNRLPQLDAEPSLFLMGHSSGAHIAALVALDPQYLAQWKLTPDVISGVVAMSGPYDFVPSDDRKPIFNMRVGETKVDPATQPIDFADHPAPPFLLIHGVEDEVVAISQSKEFAAALRANGTFVETHFYRGRGHILPVLALAWPFRNVEPVLNQVDDFFARMTAGRAPPRAKPTPSAAPAAAAAPTAATQGSKENVRWIGPD